MRTHDIGRAFWCVLDLTPDAPFAHRAPMYQARWPYLQGRTFIFKLGLKKPKGLVLGWWSPPDPQAQEEQLLLSALRGHVLGEIKSAPKKATGYREAKLTFTRPEDAERLVEKNYVTYHGG